VDGFTRKAASLTSNVGSLPDIRYGESEVKIGSSSLVTLCILPGFNIQWIWWGTLWSLCGVDT